MSSVTEYKYTRLKDVKPGSMIYHVYGVVKFFKEPRRTKGPDWSMTVVITDESLGWDGKITCNLFLREPSSFPVLTKIGSVVRFHRIRINDHYGKIQGLSSPGFAALVSERGSTEPKSTKPNYTYSDRDKFRVKELMNWSQPFVGEELAEHYKKISDVGPNQFFDLQCQVIGFAKVSDHQAVLKIWDGTKPQQSLQIMRVLDDDDPRLQYDHVNYPHVHDYLVDVSVFDDHVQETDAILLGDYITFYNLRAFVPSQYRNEVPASKIELCLHQGTAYGRSVKTMDDTDARRLRKELNKILETAAVIDPSSESTSGRRLSSEAGQRSGSGGESQPIRTPTPSTSSGRKSEESQAVKSPQPSTSLKRKNEDSVVEKALGALGPCLSMEVYANLVVWTKKLGESPVPKHVPNLHPALKQFKASSCLVTARVSMDDNYHVAQTIVLFCQHCHFLSALPRLDEVSNASLSKGRKRARLARKCQVEKPQQKEVDQKTVTFASNSEKKKIEVCTVPLTEFCQAVYKVKNLRLRAGDWLEGATPCLAAPNTGDYYLCPNCAKQKNEDDPCILKYRFYMTLTLEDSTGTVPVFVWEDILRIEDVNVSARDVVGDGELMNRYETWLKQFSKSLDNDKIGELYQCNIKTISRKNLRKTVPLYQLMKIEPQAKVLKAAKEKSAKEKSAEEKSTKKKSVEPKRKGKKVQ